MVTRRACRKNRCQPSVHIKVGRRTICSGYEQNFKTFRSIFVSTDYLLRDDMEELPCAVNPSEEAEPIENDKGEALIKVSLETANEYLEHRKKSSVSIAAGVMLCILSPILLIYLGVAGEMKKIPLTEDKAQCLD